MLFLFSCSGVKTLIIQPLEKTGEQEHRNSINTIKPARIFYLNVIILTQIEQVDSEQHRFQNWLPASLIDSCHPRSHC